MRYLNNTKLQLTSVDGRILFELYGNFNELASDFLRREEWLVTEFPDAYKFEIKDGITKYVAIHECNHRPTLRLIGMVKYKDRDGKPQTVDYQISAIVLNFEYEVK